MTARIPTITHQESAAHDDPLGTYPEQFQRHLESQYYRPSTIARYDYCIKALRIQMIALGVNLCDLDEDRAVELIGRSPNRSFRSKTSASIIAAFVRFLAALGATKPVLRASRDDNVHGRLKQDYENYLRCRRGLSEKTTLESWRIAERFLRFRFGAEAGDLSQITAIDIAGFLEHLTTRKPPLRDKTLSSHLRNFFRYLFLAGKTSVNLTLGIPSVAQRYGARLPRHLTAEQVDILVKAVRTNTATSRRNYAMVLLTARLGLRAPEIVAMQIDDIHWRSGEIIVRGKGNRHDRVPLPPDVGEALADYIRSDRTTASRSLFVTSRPPHGPFKGGPMLNLILKGAFARAGLTLPARYVGWHILRHSLATNLVRRGASLEEISDVLRHRCRASTMIYAKLDINGLRSIAQSWPVVGGGK
jgi:site-specific recombinase XerD